MKEASRNPRWTPEEDRILSEMWLCGISSTGVGTVIGRTRNAVMGRVNKTGLMGRQGRGIMPTGICDGKVRMGIETMYPQIFDRPRLPGVSDDVAAVVLAFVASGRECRPVHHVAGVTEIVANEVEACMTDLGIWPRGGCPKPEWWTEGHSAIRRDVDMIVGMMTKDLIAA